jgi:hypothetical protein
MRPTVQASQIARIERACEDRGFEADLPGPCALRRGIGHDEMGQVAAEQGQQRAEDEECVGRPAVEVEARQFEQQRKPGV